MNVLIISNYFSPQESVGAQRPNAMCRYFSEEGDRVFVISTPKGTGALRAELGGGDVSVYSVGYWGSGQKIDLVDGRFDVKKNVKKNKLLSVLKGTHRRLKKNIFCNFLDPRSLWVPSAVRVARRLIMQFGIDLIISSSPAYPVHLVASRLKREFPKVFWSADYRDLWSGNPFFTGIDLFKNLEIKNEIACLRHADVITTVSHALADYLSQLHGKEAVVYTNGYESRDVKEKSESCVTSSGLPRKLVYTGAYIDHLYDIRPFLKALEMVSAHVKQSQLQVIFIGDNDAIKEKARQYPVAFSYIQFLGQVNREDALEAQVGADLLLFFGAQENGGKAIKGVVSGKIFEYMISRTEIMAIGTSSDMEVGKIIQELQAGACYENDSDLIAKRIFDLVRDGKKECHIDPLLLSSFRRDVITKKMRQDLISRMRDRDKVV